MKTARCNTELMWLLVKLAPDFKTVADFRRDNGEALRRPAPPSSRSAGKSAC